MPAPPDDGPSTPLLTVGWREWVALPELGIPAVKAKVDTGARTSALHARGLDVFDRHGQPHVRFHLHPLRNGKGPLLRCEAPVVDRRVVTSSSGQREKRPVIAARLALGGRTWTVEVTLTNRRTMRFRMLLGRRAMAGHLQVDPAASYRTGRALARAYDAQRGG